MLIIVSSCEDMRSLELGWAAAVLQVYAIWEQDTALQPPVPARQSPQNDPGPQQTQNEVAKVDVLRVSNMSVSRYAVRDLGIPEGCRRPLLQRCPRTWRRNTTKHDQRNPSNLKSKLSKLVLCVYACSHAR